MNTRTLKALERHATAGAGKCYAKVTAAVAWPS